MTNLPFFNLFTADIVGATRATEDSHNICLSEPLAPIVKFPARDLPTHPKKYGSLNSRQTYF